MKKKNPLISGLLSLILPGAGQVYNENFIKGLVLFVIIVISIGSIVQGAFYLGIFEHGQPHWGEAEIVVRIVISALALAATWIYGIIDAVVVAQRLNSYSLKGESGQEGYQGSEEGGRSGRQIGESRLLLGVMLLLIGLGALAVQFGFSFRILFKLGIPLVIISLGGYILYDSIRGGEFDE